MNNSVVWLVQIFPTYHFDGFNFMLACLLNWRYYVCKTLTLHFPQMKENEKQMNEKSQKTSQNTKFQQIQQMFGSKPNNHSILVCIQIKLIRAHQLNPEFFAEGSKYHGSFAA